MPGTDELTNAHAPVEAPSGIGGWLIIPAIGLVWAPIMSAMNLVLSITLLKMVDPEMANDSRLWIIWLIDVAIIAATVSVAWAFFSHRRVAVKAIILLMVAIIAASVVQLLLNARVSGADTFDNATSVVRPCVFSAIWIPYFLKSRRVKNTFIK